MKTARGWPERIRSNPSRNARRVHVYVFLTCAAGIRVFGATLARSSVESSWWGADWLVISMALAEVGGVELNRDLENTVHAVAMLTAERGAG